jgi:hypothetical protein
MRRVAYSAAEPRKAQCSYGMLKKYQGIAGDISIFFQHPVQLRQTFEELEVSDFNKTVHVDSFREGIVKVFRFYGLFIFLFPVYTGCRLVRQLKEGIIALWLTK